ncbi:DNA replication/repair protein RecF [Actibacterium sp. 188UL27-1]|uniref:DNA replication/repair protein RecF n=1 Tax=Actibacterium sp. 188UL27-1 TaxID=2786961 RepID=UPI00195AA67E|nr:DNA replication/repair protein RecF [Actibacterium sp. 188UL27-1]MBM7066464.1 DNA replication/repair protein RecF [Actibacterium sp. 188UL27-1]
MSGLSVAALTLSHFRSHKMAEMALDGRPVALFGPNGAGKTNLLEGVSLLSPGRGLRRAAADEIARKPEALGWKVSAELQSLCQIHEVETWAEPGASRSVTVDGKTAPQLALGRIARVVWLIPAMDRLWIEGAEGRRRFLDRMTLSFEPRHGEVVLAYDKAMRERNRLLKDQVQDPGWYDALEGRMASFGAQIMANRQMAVSRVAMAQDGAETSFPKADQELIDPDGNAPLDTEPDLRAALQAGRSTDLRAGRTLQGPHRIDLHALFAAKGIPAKQCSTGEQKALLLSLILSNARALAQDFGAPPLLLLDEVAAHLDADRRAALYDEICALKAQAWMTGTGADLFADLGDRAQTFEVTDDQGTSEIRAH